MRDERIVDQFNTQMGCRKHGSCQVTDKTCYSHHRLEKKWEYSETVHRLLLDVKRIKIQLGSIIQHSH